MAERKSPLMAIIGKDGPQGFETADGLKVDLGGGGSGGVKLYKHEIIIVRQVYKYVFNILSTKKESFIDTDVSNFMSKVIFLNGEVYEYGTNVYVGTLIAFAFNNDSAWPYEPVIYSHGSIIGGPPVGSVDSDSVTEWDG